MISEPRLSALLSALSSMRASLGRMESDAARLREQFTALEEEIRRSGDAPEVFRGAVGAGPPPEFVGAAPHPPAAPRGHFPQPAPPHPQGLPAGAPGPVHAAPAAPAAHFAGDAAPLAPMVGGYPTMPAARPRRPLPSISTVIAAIGGAVLLLGVVFLLVLAAQAGYFGPVPRVAGAALLAVVLIGGGLRLHLTGPDDDSPARASRESGALALVGTGVVTAILDVVAAATLYHWIPDLLALTLCALLAVGGLLLARWWRSVFLSCLVIVGAVVLTPYISFGVELAVLVVIVVIAAAVLVRHLPGPVQVVWMVIPALILGPLTLVNDPRRPVEALLILLCLLGFALTGALVVLEKVLRHPGRSRYLALGVLSTASPLPAIGTLSVIDPAWPLLAGLAALYLITSGWIIRSGHGRAVDGSMAAATFGITGTLLVLATAGIIEDSAYGVLILLGAATGFAVVAGLTRTTWARVVAALLSVTALFTYVLQVGPEYALSAHRAVSTLGLTDAALSLAAAVLFGALTWWAATAMTAKDRAVFLVAGPVAALAALSVAIVALGVTIGSGTGDADAGFRGAHLAVTTVWIVVAAVSVLARPTGLPEARRTGFVLGGLALIKLFLLDLAALPGIFRVLSFLVVGAVLLAVATRYSTDDGHTDDPGRRTPPGSAQPPTGQHPLPHPPTGQPSTGQSAAWPGSSAPWS